MNRNRPSEIAWTTARYQDRPTESIPPASYPPFDKTKVTYYATPAPEKPDEKR